MTLEKECACCGHSCIISFEYIEGTTEWPDDVENANDIDEAPYPEFCPFCGAHDSDEESPEDDDEER